MPSAKLTPAELDATLNRLSTDDRYNDIPRLRAHIEALSSDLLVAERFAESQRFLKEQNIQRWTKAQERLARIELTLIELTGRETDIEHNLATLAELRGAKEERKQ